MSVTLIELWAKCSMNAEEEAVEVEEKVVEETKRRGQFTGSTSFSKTF